MAADVVFEDGIVGYEGRSGMTPFSDHFLKKTMLLVTSLQDLDQKKLLETLEKHTFACIRGLVSPEEVSESKKKMWKNFNPEKDSPGTGESPEQIMGLYQKLAVGGVIQNHRIYTGDFKSAGVLRPRFMRTLYTPFWEEDIFGLHSLFRRICQVRNLLYGFPVNFCIDQVEGGLWTAARIHHYPSGGGFLWPHLDEVLTKVQENEKIKSYYQPFLIMSRHGEDFEKGGGFFEKDGERFYFERHCLPGDIGIYDGRTIHGVEDVDPHKKIDLRSLNGRMVGFVSLYKDLRKKSGAQKQE